jgi:ribosomal protein S18 acetylase RimI-like enzyme
MADCEYQIGGEGKFYSESEFKKLLSEGYLDKVMMEKSLTIKGIKPNEAIASSFQLPSAIQPIVPTTEAKTEEVVTPTGDKNNYKIAQDVTAEVSKENPDASVLLTPKGEDLSLTAVYVGKENRGKGIGTKVLESVKKQADKLGKKIVLDATTELDEETDLGRLESFYQKNGFTKVGENKFEYNPITETKTEEVVTPVAEVKSENELPTSELDKIPKGKTFQEDLAPEYYKELKEDISKNGIKQPIKLEYYVKDNALRIKDGHHRFKIAKELGITNIPVEVNVVWNKKINEVDSNKDIEGQPTYNPPSALDVDFYKQRMYSPGTIKLSEIGYSTTPNETVTKTEKNVTEPADEVERLRAEEQKELLEAIPNIEFLQERNMHRGYMTAEDVANYERIYNKYDKLITPLLKQTTAEAKEEVSDDRVAEEFAKSTNGNIDYAKKSISDVEKYNNGEVSPREYLESRGYSEENFFEVGADRDVKDFLDLTEEEFKEVADRTAGYQNNKINEAKQKVQAETVTKTEPTAETAPETKQPTKEAVAAKNLADFLRRGKSEKGTAMASPIPGFNQIWDATIETVAKAIEVGGVTAGNFRQSINDGMKALRNTDAYKAITDPKERAKISSQYRKALVDLVPQHFNFNADNLRAAEFDTFNEELEAAKGKDLDPKAFNALKARAKKFVNDNLPVDNYRKTEVKSYVAKNFDKAKNVADIQKNLEAVNALLEGKEAKIAEKSKEQLIKDITDKIKANSKKVIRRDRRTRRKQGKITIPAQQELNQVIQDLKDQGMFNNLESLTTEELSDLNNSLDNIIKTGRAEQKQLTALEQAKIKADKAMILRSLTSSPDDILNGEEEINERLDQTDGHVIVDDKLMSHSDFKDYVKKNPDADLENVEFYYSKDASKVREKLEKDTTIRQRIRNTTLWTVSDLETHLAKLGAKAKGLKTWIEGNIAKPIREGRRKSIETVWRETRSYKKKTREIFGNETTMFKALTAPTSVKAKNSEESLSAGQVVHLFNILNNTDPNKREADAKRLMKKNYISAEDVFNFMEDPENKQLLDYANYLSEQYNGPLRTLFGPTIENLHNIDLGSDYYYPQPASKSEAENITDSNNNISLSVTAPNMRHREDNPTSGFELIDAHQMYLSYIDSMSHAKEFIPVVKAINTLISDVNRPYIMEKFGSASDYSDFIQTLKNTVTNESLYAPGALTAFNNAISLSLLWFRIQSVPQQMSSMIHYYHAGIKDGVYPHDVLRAVPTNKKELEFVKDFYADNPYLYNRLGGANIDPEMKKLKEQIDSNANKLVKGTLNFVQFAGLFPIKFGDATAAASIGGGMSFALAQYKQAFKETGDADYAKEQAMQRWYEETERTGQVSVAREIMSTKSFDNVVRLFIPFSSAQQGVVKKIYKAYLNTKDWKNLDPKEKAQTVSDLIYFSVAAPLPFLMSGAIGYALVSMLSDDDEDEKEMTRLLYDLGTDAAQSHFTALGLPGLLLNTATNIARDKSHFNESPAYSRKEDIGIQLVKMLSANKTWDDLTSAERKDFIKNYKGERFGSFENTYNESSMWDKTTRKDIDEALESIGVLNLSKLYNRLDNLGKDKDIAAFALGVDRTRTEMNKKLDPYFNKAVESGKKDALFEFAARTWRDATGEDVDTKYIPEGAEKPKKSRKSSSDPFKFKKSGPSPFKKKF